MKQDSSDKPTLNLRDVRRRADSAAAVFDSADFVHTVTRDGLFARLEPLLFEPVRILDLGCATGSASAGLRKSFGPTHIVSLDLSRDMLRHARRKRARFSRSRASFVQADAAQLPFEDQSFDLVFSNLLLPFTAWSDPIFAEVARVLQKGGVFAFATLGPDSLEEIRRAWRRIDTQVHVNQFPDMHDVGDALLRAGLRDPVLDVDRLAVHYQDPARLFSDLGNVAARNTLQQRSRSLMGRQRFTRLREALTDDSRDGKIRLDLEIVYGHCWGGGSRQGPADYTIDASNIPRRRG